MAGAYPYGHGILYKFLNDLAQAQAGGFLNALHAEDDGLVLQTGVHHLGQEAAQRL